MYMRQRLPDRFTGSNAEPFEILMMAVGGPVNLLGAVVRFRMAHALTGALKVDKLGTGTATGIASYRPTLADVDTAGEYVCQWIATFSDGRIHRSETVDLRLLRALEGL